MKVKYECVQLCWRDDVFIEWNIVVGCPTDSLKGKRALFLQSSHFKGKIVFQSIVAIRVSHFNGKVNGRGLSGEYFWFQEGKQP